MKNVNWKDVGTRAFKTFVQAAIPLVIAALSGIDFANADDKTWSVLAATGLSAIAAGISAAWNGVISPLIGTGVAKGDDDSET